MINAIIGAKGEMAQNLLLPLLQKLGPVCTADKNDPDEKWQKVWKADVIWLSVPRDAIPEIFKNVRLTPNQLIIDICSIKRRISDFLQSTGAAHLSLHPLHGPYIPLNGQKWAIIHTHKTTESHPHAKTILSFLKEQGISFLEAQSEDEHDFMMGVTLSLPEFLTIVIDSLMSQYTKDCGQEKPDMKKLMEWAVPASNALFSAYIHSINSSADWLRKDLILGAHGNLTDSAKKTFASLSKITLEEINKKIVEQNKFVSELPLEERKRVRQWIERWFVDATQKIFTFHKRLPMNPKLNIQYHADINEVLPVQKGKITVGIHGIEGCFTHESVLRFCEELKIDSKKIDFKYLIEAKRVIDAVAKGEIDRGVFCTANSGSGAYVSSMHAMGEYQFDVLAIYGMEILQCLMAHPSVKDISEIKEVFGHPQAVSQCKRTFAEKYPQIKLTPGEDSDDTALCAKRIAQGEFPKSTATLASQVAGKLYGLNILEYGMHHDPFNTTTFLIIKKS